MLQRKKKSFIFIERDWISKETHLSGELLCFTLISPNSYRNYSSAYCHLSILTELPLAYLLCQGFLVGNTKPQQTITSEESLTTDTTGPGFTSNSQDITLKFHFRKPLQDVPCTRLDSPAVLIPSFHQVFQAAFNKHRITEWFGLKRPWRPSSSSTPPPPPPFPSRLPPTRSGCPGLYLT